MARFRDTLLRLLGSSSGETILKAAATASGTITLPAVTDTVAVLGTAQTFTATESFSPGGDSAIKIGQYTTATHYNIISFNGALDSTAIGIIAGGTGDNTLYLHVPSSGAYAFQAGASNVFTLDASGNTSANGQTTTATKLATTTDPTANVSLDSSTTSATVANGSSVALPAASGVIIVCETGGINGSLTVYLMGGGVVSQLGSATNGMWVAPTSTPGAGQASVQFDVGTFRYRVYNNRGGTLTFAATFMSPKAAV